MSYDCELLDPVTKETLHAEKPHLMRGGTYKMGGDTRMYLNVTFNYSPYFVDIAFNEEETGLYCLGGRSGAESIPVLKRVADNLKDDVTDNYWDSTEGNAKQALFGLIALAQMRPDGVWDIQG